MTDLPEGWTVDKVEVFRLRMPDGKVVVRANGEPADYDTYEDAAFVAVTWDLHRAPTWAELQAMSDAELRVRAGLAPAPPPRPPAKPDPARPERTLFRRR